MLSIFSCAVCLFSGKALLQLREGENKQQIPLSTRSLRGGQACSLYGVMVGVFLGGGLEGWCSCLPTPCGTVCSGHPQYPAFALGSSKVAVGFLVSLYLLTRICLNFSCMWFLCILLLEESCVQVQALPHLQQRVPSPILSPSPLRDSALLFLRGKGSKASSETSSCWTGAIDPSSL